jgi:hypothetical protein
VQHKTQFLIKENNMFTILSILIACGGEDTQATIAPEPVVTEVVAPVVPATETVPTVTSPDETVVTTTEVTVEPPPSVVVVK